MTFTARFAPCAILLALGACAAPLTPPPPAAVATNVQQPNAATTSKESLTIDFRPAGAGLSPTADAQLDGAARLYRNAQPEVMIVAGHTDKVGGEYSNLLLSAKRANMVKQALVDRGVPAQRLQIIAVGEAEPTPGLLPSRSVVVTWR